ALGADAMPVSRSPAGIAVGQTQATVRGRVTDVNGNGITGVSVSLKGTGSGTTTDASGNFSINAPENGVLVFTYVGFVAQEIPVNGRQTIEVVLKDESTALEEV